MGTGHIWRSPDFKNDGQWISNYSEWFGPKQDIMFATSTDLVRWEKIDEEYRFVQDTRWYKARGRWDCIDVLEQEDGTLYGYFTASPDVAKVKYQHCGFGMAELYVNDYLMNLKRVKWNGRLGIIGRTRSSPKGVEVWRSE